MAPPGSIAIRHIAVLLLILGASCSDSDTPRRESGPVGAWTAIAKAPIAIQPVAVWTGNQMLVWGPQVPHEAPQGGPAYGAGRGLSFDPATDRWTEIAPGPLGSRAGHSAIWAGDRMIVLGGRHDPFEDDRFDGAAYDPASNRWNSIAKSPIPLGRVSIVWTGSRVLVFAPRGGDPQPGPQGASYDPAKDRWTVIASSSLKPRVGEAFVWTGSRMIVWGGETIADPPTPLADGASYDPSADRWTSIAQAPITGRRGSKAVWTGNRMIVWGGYLSRETCADVPSPAPGQPCQAPAVEDALLLDGASYDPATDQWTRIASARLEPRGHYDNVVWTGDRLIVCCGEGNDRSFVDGASYNPRTNRWTPIVRGPLGFGFYPSAAVWTGARLIVWGAGCIGEDCSPVAQGASFEPAA